MKQAKVFSEKQLPADVKAYIEEHAQLEIWDSPEPMPRELLLQKATGADGLLTSGSPINRELLEQAPRLRVVSSISVGYNHFDLETMREYGVIGTHTPYVLDDTVADLVLGLMLAAARRIPELDALTKRGEWIRASDRAHFGLDVHHKKLGIIGMGRIGEAIAKRGRFGFEMEVGYCNRSRKPEAESRLGIRYQSMDELLRESDFVVLMVPLSKETTKMIGEREFKLMKKSAIFINASRGQTVDEQALAEALQAGWIRAAGLDVYEQEPARPDHPLLGMPNVVTLPHIGSATDETRHAMAMLAARNLIAALAGRKPPHVVKELDEFGAD